MAEQGRTAIERFVRLWTGCAEVPAEQAATIIHARLCAAYVQPWRHYHSLAHIEHCLREFDGAKAHMTSPDQIELALWYHDAVYQPGDACNEQRSAELFVQDARGQLPAAIIGQVYSLIMATTHLTAPDVGPASWVVDIDLSSFGLPWPAFLADSRDVRAELHRQDDAQYYPSHGGFLRGLRARPRIFTTEYFHERYEQQARDNINRLLEAYATDTRL